MKVCNVAFGLFFALALHSISVAQTVCDTSLTVRTKTPLTPLLYGTGQDRLGGARFETLDSGVVLRVDGLTRPGLARIDSATLLYRVRLAPGLHAYVASAQVVTDTLPRPATLLTGNWRVWGVDSLRSDFVRIALPARLPYASRPLAEPNEIVLDVFGATVNTNWITQLRSTKAIRRVWFEVPMDETLRIHIVLNQRHWGYVVSYQKNTLLVRVRHAPPRRRLRGLTVAIDAGHGGSNLGAQGRTSGRFEKEFTLDVAQRLARQLQRAGATVLMLRSTDTLLGPTARLLAMRRALPDVLVSIHFNSAADTAVRGVSTYYKHSGFRPLSEAVLARMLRDLPVAEFGNVGHFNFYFNAPTEYQNVLVEGPFLSHRPDEALILDECFRENMARAIRRGLRDWARSKE